MKASTELFLWHLFSIAESMLRPSYMRADETFEGWAARSGMLRQIHRLEAQAYLERLPGGAQDRVYRLTPKGRLAALGGKDPEALWNRPWDGKWRLILFDLPMRPTAPRVKLRKVLREHGFGCLQGSLWISPDPLDSLRKQLRGDRHPSSLLLFEGGTVGGERPAEVVREAWNFERLKEQWTSYGEILARGNMFLKRGNLFSDPFRQWTVDENLAWKQIVAMDPFLPRPLLPRGYPGRKLWKRRLRFWKRVRPALEKARR